MLPSRENMSFERVSKQEMTCTFGSKKKYEQNINSNEREPNFGTKRSYTDKQNHSLNFEPQERSQKIMQKTKTQASIQDIQKDQKCKKYAYIKNSNSLIHSQKYSQDQNHQEIQSQNRQYEILRKRQNQRSPVCQSENSLQRMGFSSKNQQIAFLKQSLQNERDKFQQFQQQTIKNQMKILDTISNLEAKLKELKSQNLMLYEQNTRLKEQNCNKEYEDLPKFRNFDLYHEQRSLNYKNNEINELKAQIENLEQKLNRKQLELKNLEHDYKKIKGVGKGIVDMMKKVDHLEIPEGEDEVKYAWKWVKKVVWEYEAIRKKAFEWKKAYDELNKDSQNEESMSSEQGY